MGRTKIPRIEVTQEYLRSVLDYEPETGVFTWLSDGSVAGSPKDKRGYIRVNLSAKNREYAHRLAFIYMTGACPRYIDHEDENKANTAWKNLRPTTKSTNGMNRGAPKNNKTGFKGVQFYKNGYVAVVQANGKNHYLWRYKSAELADSVVRAARERLHGEFARHA